MPWTYIIRTGHLYAPDGTLAGTGYSGHGASLNDPARTNRKAEGPIPAGEWDIGDDYDSPGHLGPVVMALTPIPGTEVFGRSLFRLHGDNGAANHTASDGCIIMSRTIREAVANSEDASLTVVAEEEDKP